MRSTARLTLSLAAGVALALAPLAPAAQAATGAGTRTVASTSDVTSHLPNGWRAQVAHAPGGPAVGTPARDALLHAIDPTQYECGPTDFDAYIDGLIDAMPLDDLIFLVTHIEMLDIPTYDALLYGGPGDARYALRADSAHQLTKTFTDAKRFWDIESGDIQLIAMHGSTLTDPARVSRVLQTSVFGFTAAAAATYANDVATYLAAHPTLSPDNPLFTLNAFAFTAEGDPDPLVQGVPDKLVFGDGILDAMAFLGISDVGPRAVLAHEFGHHVQYEDGLFDTTLTGPEATRRTELMADAFGTYFAVHARGLALNAKRVVQAELSFYEVGDCAFDDDGHHGTPNQRLRASTWGADLATGARPQGKILPSLTVDALFEQALPTIVAPDAA